jgi:hypothetical protein
MCLNAQPGSFCAPNPAKTILYAADPQPNVFAVEIDSLFDIRAAHGFATQHKRAPESPEGDRQASGANRQLPDRLPLPTVARESAA